MRFINSLTPRNYRNATFNLNSRKCSFNEYPKKSKIEKSIEITEQKPKKKTVSNFIFVLFTCFFFNNRTNAINFNETSKTQAASIMVDGNLLGIKREDIFNEKFLFSNRTTQNTEIESEIEEIEDDEFRYSAWKNSQVGLTVGGSALSMWFAYKGLNVWEKWMKDQEQKDIEEEIEMTGTYINPGAGSVESSIDPITGKKIEIKQNKENDDKDKKPNKD